jgi:hypothetical protein
VMQLSPRMQSSWITWEALNPMTCVLKERPCRDYAVPEARDSRRRQGATGAGEPENRPRSPWRECSPAHTLLWTSGSRAGGG